MFIYFIMGGGAWGGGLMWFTYSQAAEQTAVAVFNAVFLYVNKGLCVYLFFKIEIIIIEQVVSYWLRHQVCNHGIAGPLGAPKSQVHLNTAANLLMKERVLNDHRSTWQKYKVHEWLRIFSVMQVSLEVSGLS